MERRDGEKGWREGTERRDGEKERREGMERRDGEKGWREGMERRDGEKGWREGMERKNITTPLTVSAVCGNDGHLRGVRHLENGLAHVPTKDETDKKVKNMPVMISFYFKIRRFKGSSGRPG